MNMTLTQNYYTPRVAKVEVAAGLAIRSRPDRPMRGVQVGYRPKTNSYDGLTPELFEELVTDLAMFGANMIELIPHAFDDAPYSPHYGLSHDAMNTAMSAILARCVNHRRHLERDLLGDNKLFGISRRLTPRSHIMC